MFFLVSFSRSSCHVNFILEENKLFKGNIFMIDILSMETYANAQLTDPKSTVSKKFILLHISFVLSQKYIINLLKYTFKFHPTEIQKSILTKFNKKIQISRLNCKYLFNKVIICRACKLLL